MTPDDGPLSGHAEIDALLDGEVVNRTALRRALDDPAARDYLVDALALRQLTRDMGPASFVAPAARRGALHRASQWMAAAVILLAGAGLGYVYGERFQSQPSSQGTIEVVVDSGSASPPAPEPTRLIRFEPGVNWTTTTRSQ